MNRWNLRYVEKRIRNVGLLIGLERETNNNNNMMNDEKKAKKKVYRPNYIYSCI